MHEETLTPLQLGLVLYDTSGILVPPVNRWGDYTAAAPDLTNPFAPAFWFAAESSKTSTTFRTAIGKSAYTAVNQP